MTISGVEELNLWSQEAMIYYLLFLVIGSIVTSHVIEALCIILTPPKDADQRLAKQRLKQSIRRYKELSNAYSSTGQHEPRPDRTHAGAGNNLHTQRSHSQEAGSPTEGQAA